MINIKTMWENQKPTGDIITKTKIDGITHLNCFVGTNHITGQHLYVMHISKDIAIPELKNYRFKGVEIYTVPNEIDNVFEFYIYLLDNDLKDIFLLFVQNILDDIEKILSEKEALTTTLNVISKWKKLFDKIYFNGLTLDQQKGLIGELLFFNTFLDSQKPSSSILTAWTASDFNDKDFVFGSTGIEIKFTSSKHPKIKITSERQLDISNLDQLVLLLYIAEEVKGNGFSLNSLVEQIRQKISNDDERNFFNERLLLLGYHGDDREHYNNMYSLKKICAYKVSPDFPKIIQSDLPLGIYDTSYSIELSAVSNFELEKEEILRNI